MNKKISLILKILSLLFSIYGMIMMYEGVVSFTYFTNLSNLFLDVILCFLIYKDIMEMKQKKINYGTKFYILRFSSVISIILTFLVYLFVIAPTNDNGVIGAYLYAYCGSAGVHLFGPLLAIFEFFIFDKYKYDKKFILYSTIPSIVYTIFVFIISLFGFRWDGMSGPYNFLNYGAETGWFGFNLNLLSYQTLGIGVFYNLIVIAILFILMSFAVYKIKSLIK